MTSRARAAAIWIGILVVASAAGALLLNKSGAAGPSTLSPSASGWLATREYLERRGTKVALLDRPLEAAPPGRALALVFPWQAFPSDDEITALQRFLAGGGTVVFAYSGQPRDSYGEARVAGALGMSIEQTRGEPPLGPRTWWRFVNEEWRLRPSAALGSHGAGEVLIRAPESAPKAPAGASAGWLGPGERPAVFSYERRKGRVVVLPADALSNGRVGNPGNAGLLESLRASLPDAVAFDEYHHGLVAPGPGEESSHAASLDLLMLELALLYLLCAWSLARRFGPPWHEQPEIAGSTPAFLLGIGALHRKLRHSAAATLRLIENAEALDPGLAIPAGLRESAFTADDDEFLSIARNVARHQGRRRLD